jgi:hypothetical protein
MATEKPNSSPSKHIKARNSQRPLSDTHFLSLDSLRRSRPPQIQALLQGMNRVVSPASTSNMVSTPITSNTVFTPSTSNMAAEPSTSKRSPIPGFNYSNSTTRSSKQNLTASPGSFGPQRKETASFQPEPYPEFLSCAFQTSGFFIPQSSTSRDSKRDLHTVWIQRSQNSPLRASGRSQGFQLRRLRPFTTLS